MKVVLVVGRSTGGIGTHAVDLADGLRELGDEVSFVTDALTAERFGIADARLWWPGRSAGPVGSIRSFGRLRRLARTADVVHAQGHQAGLVSALAMVGLRTPLVVSQHNAVLVGGLRRRLLDLAQRFVARRADLVTGASSDLVAESARLGARQVRLAPVPSPRVPGLLAEDPLADDQRRALAAELLRENGIESPAPDAALVLSIARVAPQKDLGTFVDTIACLRVAVCGVVVGGGDDDLRTALIGRIRADGLPVHLVGPQPDPTRWLRAADVFVLMSTWEARALVVQEAMAAGVPVVATDVGGLPDLLEGVGGLVPVGDAGQAADAVERYLTDPAARHTASAAGRERATSWDDGKATARRWREWYSALPGMT